jgi:putative hydrolase of the HAD superfamily
MIRVAWAHEAEPGARGWGAMVATIVAEAGFPLAKLPTFLEDVWREHVQKNLWWLVPVGFSAAMTEVRARGIKVVLVSNSEGMLDRLFAELGIRGDFDLLLDSGKIGIEKPDPRIFALALERYGVAPDAALHLGDIFATDITGARSAGMRAALVDPFGHYDGMFEDVPRVPGVVAVAHALVKTIGAPEAPSA